MTSAIKQADANPVGMITGLAEREAVIGFAKSTALSPDTMGRSFQEIAREPACRFAGPS